MTDKQKVRGVMAGLFGTGFFVMLGFLLFVEIPQGNREVLITLMGGMAGSVATILSFYFGDSEGRD